jgi:hypothetical protein
MSSPQEGEISHDGGCLCGAVRYRAFGEPRSPVVCHCTFCQRLTGSAFLIETVFLKEKVAFQGRPFKVYEHRSDDHGRMLYVQFCPECGTSFGMTFERFPLVQAIFAGTYDDPNWFKIERHIFIRSSVHWMVFPPEVNCFERHSIKIDGTPETPVPAHSTPWRYRV